MTLRPSTITEEDAASLNQSFLRIYAHDTLADYLIASRVPNCKTAPSAGYCNESRYAQGRRGPLELEVPCGNMRPPADRPTPLARWLGKVPQLTVPGVFSHTVPVTLATDLRGSATAARAALRRYC